MDRLDLYVIERRVSVRSAHKDSPDLYFMEWVCISEDVMARRFLFGG